MHRKSTLRKIAKKEKAKEVRIKRMDALGIANKCDQCRKEGFKVYPVTLRDGTPQQLCIDCARKTYKMQEVGKHRAIKRGKHEIAKFKRGHPLKVGIAGTGTRETKTHKSKHAAGILKRKHPELIGADGTLGEMGELPKIPRKRYSLRDSVVARNRRKRQKS